MIYAYTTPGIAYHDGYINGCSNCLACRKRLEESKQNLAFDRRFSI